MANTYFQFKQFKVEQSLTAMKVGVDGVLLGCLASSSNPTNVLDIGTGTGLIALMMAQRFPQAKVKAIDIDSAAAMQAADNAENSPWNDRIEVIHSSLADYQPSLTFSQIVSNPPFYVNAKASANQKRAQSRNEEFLPMHQIFQFASQYLCDNGVLSLIYPIEYLDRLICEAKKCGLHLNRRYYIRPNILKACHRVVVEFTRTVPKAIDTHIICIEVLQRHQYSDDYKRIGADFYLKF